MMRRQCAEIVGGSHMATFKRVLLFCCFVWNFLGINLGYAKDTNNLESINEDISNLDGVSIVLSDVTRADKFLMVSDIDDTVKVTGTSYLEMFWNTYVKKQAFPGMLELYRELMPKADVIVYLSSSPNVILNHVKNLLFNHFRFPTGLLELRQVKNWKKHKILALENLGPRYNSFLLIGDDTYQDPEVYSNFSRGRENSGVLNIYIHQIKGRVLPDNLISYSTAFEVALNEVKSGRLGSGQGVRVGRAILNSNDPTDLFPHYKKCPKNFEYRNELIPTLTSDSELFAMGEVIKKYIREICSVR